MAAVSIDGVVQRRTVLSANAETIIDFSNVDISRLSFMADGGTVYFKVNGSIADSNDLSANYIKDGSSFDLCKNSQIKTLHCYTTGTNIILQWDIP